VRREGLRRAPKTIVVAAATATSAAIVASSRLRAAAPTSSDAAAPSPSDWIDHATSCAIGPTRTISSKMEGSTTASVEATGPRRRGMTASPCASAPW
jgi:hypothetical protein